jgi:hypothetical protein
VNIRSSFGADRTEGIDKQSEVLWDSKKNGMGCKFCNIVFKNSTKDIQNAQHIFRKIRISEKEA